MRMFIAHGRLETSAGVDESVHVTSLYLKVIVGAAGQGYFSSADV